MFINGLEQATGASIPSLSFYADEVIYSSSMVNELGEPKATAYSTDLAINYSATYQGLKDIVDYINNYKERMNIKSFTAVYSEETGGVTGSMVIGLYSVNDETHIYKAPEVIGVKIGTDNIFNSFD